MDWNVPASFPSLKENEIHIWLVDLRFHFEKVSLFEKSLLADEMARAKRLRTIELYNKFVISRGTLRYILGKYLILPPEQVRFLYMQHGKPYVDSSLGFNLSHSHDLAIIAVSNHRRVGIDIEYKRELENLHDLCDRFLPAIECHQIFTSPLAHQLTVFYDFWVKKEAYTKAAGVSLFEVLAEFKKANRGVDTQNEFLIQPILINTQYACAFATDSTFNAVKYWRFCLEDNGADLFNK